ncbi:PPE family protein [Mycobacterium angelicum]|uniref:PPE family protein n=1 Tax=Mycobacterium angelicum TaxID=470074 RepID=A0A1X0A7H1_MYCAN|nr:PPE family protein [Mycobacterium angelicum]
MVLDFAALPPEINSARMYVGAGPEPMVTAAAAWAGLAAELKSTAASYSAVVDELTGGPWFGPSSMSMAAAAIPYVSWMTTTAGQAELTANQLGAAVAAYEAAFAATVPPAEIEVNRALLASLVATNLVGQNTPAIASAEAQYAQMWAQDAAAMYSYAGASSAATTLQAFTSPPHTTDPAGPAAQAAAVGSQAASTGTTQSALSQLAAVPNLLNQLSTGTFPGSDALLAFFNSYPVQAFEQVSEDTLGLGILSYGVNFAISGVLLTAAPAIAVAFNPLAAALSAPAAAAVSDVSGDGLGSTFVGSPEGVSAGLGSATTVGKLSVPPSWGTTGTAPAIRLAATALPTPGLDGSPQAGPAGMAGYYGGAPPLGGPLASVVNAPRGDQTRSRNGWRQRVIPAIAREPEVQRDDWVDGDGAVSERDELNQLRKAAADIARQRDVLKRTAATLIQEAAHK